MGTKLLLISIAFGGGVTVGSAAAAFLTILKIIPRLVQLSNTRKHIKIYQNVVSISFILFTIIYFSNFYMVFNPTIVMVIGLLYGTFIGLISSALAEVLNVIPVLSKKFKIKDNMKYVIWALMGGKVVGSLYFWLFTK